MAAALARHHAAIHGLDATIDSAGIYAVPGQPMTPLATDALIRRHVVVPQHNSKPVSPSLISDADFIFTMTTSHKADLLREFPGAAGKTYTLREFVEGGAAGDVPDPFGGPAEVYEACADALNSVVEQLIRKLAEEQGR